MVSVDAIPGGAAPQGNSHAVHAVLIMLQNAVAQFEIPDSENYLLTQTSRLSAAELPIGQ